jgi:hypothetical protein
MAITCATSRMSQAGDFLRVWSWGARMGGVGCVCVHRGDFRAGSLRDWPLVCTCQA